MATGTLFIVAALTSLAANPATGDAHWPGILDLLRQQAWPAVAVLVVLGLGLTLVLLRLDGDPPPVAGDPPPPPAPILEDWLVHRAQVREVVAALRTSRPSTVALTTALQGAGGFGKTRLARIACADPRLRRHFRDRVYLVTIGRDIRSRAAIADKVAETTRFITGDTTSFTDPDLAGDHLGALLAQRPRTLLVLDDVWERDQLAPFLRAGAACALLVTTRSPGLLFSDAHRIDVDRMTTDQARQVLTRDLPELAPDTVRDLLDVTGRWPLLLRPTNRLIHAEIAAGLAPQAAASGVLHRLLTGGPAAVDDPRQILDAAVPAERERAVRATIEAATQTLPGNGGARYTELGIFAEDEAVPVDLIGQLWRQTGALTPAQTRDLCRKLADLSLLTLTHESGGRIGLHDVYRDFLRAELGPAGLTATNAALFAALTPLLPAAVPLTPAQPRVAAAWWDLTEGYLLDHLIEHLIEAGRTAEAEAVASDIRWIEARLLQRGPTAPRSDLARVPTADAAAAAHDLLRTSHLLQSTDPGRMVVTTLHSRLCDLPWWHDQITARLGQVAGPTLVNAHPLPDLPSPAFQLALAAHTHGVTAVAIAPDGTWLAVGSADGTIRIWDRVTATLTATLAGPDVSVKMVAIAPDGSWLAAGTDDDTVRVWDRATATVTATLASPGVFVEVVVIALDGTWLAIADDDGAVRIWDRTTARITAILAGPGCLVAAMAVAPEATWFAAGDLDGMVWIWARGTVAVSATIPGTGHAVRALAISSDGTWGATGTSEGTVQIWDRSTGAINATLPQPSRQAYVSVLAISPDGSWLATAGEGGSVRIWDRATATAMAVLGGHSDGVTSVAISPDSTWLATGSRDGTVRIWNKAIATLAANTSWAVNLAVSPDGTWLATGTPEGTVQIWDRATVTITAVLTGSSDWVTSVAISPDGTWLAGGSEDGMVRIWDRATASVTATLTEPAHHGLSTRLVAISPDGTWFAVGIADNTVQIWDQATTRVTAVLTRPGTDVSALAISPDSKWLAVGSGDGKVRLWDRATSSVTAVLAGHRYCRSLSISPDATWLATAEADGAVRIWDRATATVTAVLAADGKMRSVAISPDGAWLLTLGDGDAVRVWDARTAQLVTCVRADDALAACAWMPDSRGIAVSGIQGLYLFTFRP